MIVVSMCEYIVLLLLVGLMVTDDHACKVFFVRVLYVQRVFSRVARICKVGSITYDSRTHSYEMHS